MKNLETIREDKIKLETDINNLVCEFLKDYAGVEMGLNVIIDFNYHDPMIGKKRIFTGANVKVSATLII